MNVFQISLRNIFRNKRRTLITLLAIMFGIGALMIFGGYFEWIFWGLKESTIRSQLGHVQIYKKGYLQAGSTDVLGYMIRNYDEIKGVLLKELQNEKTGRPYVEIITPQIVFTGIVGTGDRTSVCTAKGVEPAYDGILSTLDIVKEGYELSTADRFGGVIGIGLANGMNVKINDYLTLVSTTKYGGLNAVDFKAKGIFKSGVKEYDDNYIKIPINLAQEILGTRDITKIMILLDDTENTEIVHEKILALMEKYKWDIEIRTWDDLAIFYHQTSAHLKIIFTVVQLIIATIVIFTIANTVTMNVMERTSEIGTIRAIGATRFYILRSFLMEGLWFGILGGAFGIIFAIALGKIINISGIPMPPAPGQTQGYYAQIFIVSRVIYQALIMSATTAFISSIFGAIKAARMRIVDALRHI